MRTNISPNQNELEVLQKIDAKTDEILKSVKEETTASIVKAKEEIDELSQKDEKRKEQLREAQKKFKKVGFNCKESTYEQFEKLAQSLNLTTTSMTRQFMMLLLESEKFQKFFKEFSEDKIV